MRMVTLAAAATMTLSAISDGVWAAEANGNYAVLGVGNKSCGKYISERRDDNAAILAIDDLTWVQGAITAYNLYVYPGNDVSNHADSDAISAWLDNYCQGHPLGDLSTATENLITAFKSRAR